MFVRRIKRANGQVSIVLVEGYRENGKVKQRTVEYLGTESELTKNDPDAVNKLIEKYRNEQNKKEAFIKLTINLAEKISDRNTLRNYGYFYLDRMYQELGLDKICEKIQSQTDIEYSIDDCLKFLCFMRVLKPNSKKASLEKGFDFFMEDYEIKIEQLYKSLTLFHEYKNEIVERMHNQLCEKYNRNTEILYYDVTNYFFEIDEDDDFRKKGCSKEHRPNPIVQMGLFIDNQGLPVDFYLYDGNTADCSTLKPSFEDVKHRYASEKVIITADKGLNSGPNLGYILSSGNGYIVSQKIRGASKQLKSLVLSDEGWHFNSQHDFKFKEFIREITVPYPDGTKHLHRQKVVCIWSEKYQVKEKNARDNLLDKIALLAANPTKFKQSCHTGMKKYIDEYSVDKTTGLKNKTVTTQTELNLEKISEDEALDGYYLIVTSETQLSLSDEIADDSCGEHLPRRPCTLSEIEIRYQHSDSARDKTRFTAERDSRNDDQREYRLDLRQRDKCCPSRDGNGAEHRNQHQLPRLRFSPLEYQKERQHRFQQHQQRDKQVFLVVEIGGSDKDGQRNRE